MRIYTHVYTHIYTRIEKRTSKKSWRAVLRRLRRNGIAAREEDKGGDGADNALLLPFLAAEAEAEAEAEEEEGVGVSEWRKVNS